MSKKNIKFFSWVIFFILYELYMFFCFYRVPIDSDFATLVLEAKDILSGNFFLHGWNLTGVSFIFSELPFYSLGTALFGVGLDAYTFAASLMVTLCVFSALLLLRKKNERLHFLEVLFFFLIGALPRVAPLTFMRGHMAIFIYFFLSLFCLTQFFQKNRLFWIILFAFLLCFGGMSDSLILILCVIPVLLICVVNLARAISMHEIKTNLTVLIATFIGTGLGFALDKLYFLIGGANKNSFLSTRKFLELDQIIPNIIEYAQGLLKLFSADFSGKAITNGLVPWYFLRTVLILMIFTVVIRNVVRFSKNAENDIIKITLSVAILLITLISVITDIYFGLECTRYLAFIPLAGGVLLIKEAADRNFFYGRHSIGKIPLQWLSAMVAIPLFALSYVSPIATRSLTPQDSLSKVLAENGLTNGYSQFWNASHTTVASGGKIQIRPVRVFTDSEFVPLIFSMQNWFVKSSWFLEPATFVVVDDTNYLHMTKDNVIALLGNPEKIIEHDAFQILIYPDNLADRIFIPEDSAAP